MFTDEALQPVSLQSDWRKSRQAEQDSRGSQTVALRRNEAAVQTVLTSVTSCQTDSQDSDELLLFLHQSDSVTEAPGLSDFLLRVEGVVIRELVKNAKSHAFDGFTANWGDQSQQQVFRLHCLQHPSAQENGLHVTAVSWSCTGSVIVCAYGRTDDGDWSTEKSYVCAWNVDRRGLNAKQADLIIDIPTAVTALCCHPRQPALIAGGLYNGEVVVWDSSRTQDPVLAVTGMSAGSHREPVYQVCWVELQKKGEFGVLSGCSGGRVLLWVLDSDSGSLSLHGAFALMQQQVPHSSRFKARGSNTVGVTALALSQWDPDTFLVGSEGGLLLRCSFSSQTLATAPPQDHDVPLRAPAVFSFKPHCGPVHSIHCSPFHRNVFVSAGSDGSAQLHSLLQVDPLLSVRVSDSSYVYQLQWSPSRPLVFAAATGQGEVHVFDLGHKSLRPAATIDPGGAGQAATCLAFNSHNPQLLAVGKTDGTVGVWQLSADLTEQNPRESSQLEQIANQMAE